MIVVKIEGAMMATVSNDSTTLAAQGADEVVHDGNYYSVGLGGHFFSYSSSLLSSPRLVAA